MDAVQQVNATSRRPGHAYVTIRRRDGYVSPMMEIPMSHPMFTSYLVQGESAHLSQPAASHRRSSKRARVAATTEAILGLQEVTGCSHEGEECAVCLQDFRADETLRAMPCSHAFHLNCISRWLRRNAVCPLCRHQLPEEDHGHRGKRLSAGI